MAEENEYNFAFEFQVNYFKHLIIHLKKKPKTHKIIHTQHHVYQINLCDFNYIHTYVCM